MFNDDQVIRKLREAQQRAADVSFDHMVEEIIQFNSNTPPERELEVFGKLRSSGHLPDAACVFLIACVIERMSNPMIGQLEDDYFDEMRDATSDLCSELMETIRRFVEQRPIPFQQILHTVAGLADDQELLAQELAEYLPPDDLVSERRYQILSQEFLRLKENELAELVVKAPAEFQRIREQGGNSSMVHPRTFHGQPDDPSIEESGDYQSRNHISGTGLLSFCNRHLLAGPGPAQRRLDHRPN